MLLQLKEQAVLRRWRMTGVAAVLALAMPWLQACTTNPATGGSDFTPFMSPEDEVKVGAQEHQKILAQFGGAYQDKKIQGYVNGLGQQLAAKSELPNLKWTFTVLDSDIINAFALPGGFVYVSRGLIALADTEDQLAGVIGHEIGHVTARHTANRYSAAVGANVLTTIASIGVAVLAGGEAGSLVQQAGGAAAQSFLAGYSRSQELQADSLGVRYLSRTAYDTEAMSGFLDKMGKETDLLAKLRNQTPRGFSYLDTHPPTDERVQKAAALAAKTPGSGQPRSRQDFYRQINGMIYGDSPEQGFRRGRTFAHPGLRLAFDVPPDFFILNFPDKLMAQGPDGASVIFDGTQGRFNGSPAQYLTGTWALKLQLKGVQQFKVAGLDAATGYTQLRSNSGIIGLRLAAVAWPDGRMYRFQFFAPVAKAQQYDQAFLDTLRSVRQLSSGEAAALKPLRIRPYQVRKGDTISSISSKLPFDKLAEERFRVLNGLDANQQLTAGTWIKIVEAR